MFRSAQLAVLMASAALLGCGAGTSSAPAQNAGAAGRWPEIDARLERAVSIRPEGLPCRSGATAEACGLELRFGPVGTLWYDRSFGAWERDRRVPIASASKWLSAAAIMTLVDAGLVELDAPIGTYWPGLDAAHATITLRQLLSHTSGIVHQTACTNDQVVQTLQQCAQQILALPLVAEPGTQFLYGAPSFQVAGAIAERVSGLSWREFFAERLGVPLGMTATAYGSTQGLYADTTQNPQLAGGGISTASDYAAFIEMMLGHGVFRGRRVLSQEAYAQMERSNTANVQRFECPLTEADCYAVWPTAGFALGNPASKHYGYGLGNWLIRMHGACEGTLITSPGAYGAHGWIDTTRGYGGVLFLQGDYTPIAAVFDDLISTLDNRVPQQWTPAAPAAECV